jgi:hypothetical protein
VTDLTTRVVDRMSSALESRVGRRGFLRRSALVGSALAVTPTSYVLRPTSAYAAVCSCSGSSCACGALCCDGYTEFCCTLTGRNSCPPGTVAAGWWKVDGHGLCGGGPRYYLDCNTSCGSCGCSGGTCSGGCSGTACRCANGSCGNRKSGCTRFRYGQCNQHIACVGPILCRVVTCIPPWQIDGTCTTTPLTDNNTRLHDRPCLHQPFGSLDIVQLVEPGRMRVAGWMIDPDTTGSINVHIYAGTTPLVSVPANRPRPDLAGAVPGYGVNHGFDATVHLPAGSSVLNVYAINVGPGQGNPHFSRPIPRLPFGHLDVAAPSVRGIRVRGWAIDPDTAGPIAIHVYVGSRLMGIGTADVPRADIAGLYPGWGPDHGFDFYVGGVVAGTHPVRVYAINAGGGGNPLLGSAQVTVRSGQPFGSFDIASRVSGGVRVAGWAIDPDSSGPVEIHAYVDGRWAGSGSADRSRSDVGTRYPGYGPNHGFDFTVAAAPGGHSVCVYAINQGAGGANPRLGCRSV